LGYVWVINKNLWVSLGYVWVINKNLWVSFGLRWVLFGFRLGFVWVSLGFLSINKHKKTDYL